MTRTQNTPTRRRAASKVVATRTEGAAAATDAAAVAPLTAARTSKDRALYFLPDIRAWMNDTSRRKLFVKSRRIGATYAHAYDRVSRRMQGLTRHAYYTGVSLDMAREYIDYCAYHARTFGRVLEVLEGEEQVGYRTADGRHRKLAINTFTLEFPSGARIVAMPSRPAALRGRGGDMDADELAFHEDQAALYKAAISVTKWGGQFAGWSSHNGEGTTFHGFEKNCRAALVALLGNAAFDGDAWRGTPLEALVAAARPLRLRPVFSYHQTTIERAVAQGLVELLNRVTGGAHTAESFLAECRDECLNEEHYQQEYLCVATTALLAALKYHVIEACQHDACAAPVQGRGRELPPIGLVGYAGGPLYVGVDVGRTQDLTVIWVWEPVGDVLWTRAIVELAECSLVDQETAIERLFAAGDVRRCTILKRGIGQGLFDHLERKFHARVSGVDETRPIKLGLVGQLVQACEDRRVRVPLCERTKEALHSVREVRTPGGQVSYDAPRSDAGHADQFWAAAAGIDGLIKRKGGRVDFV